MTTKTTIDWDRDVAADPEEEYQALVRLLHWTEGFGLFFIRCSPAKGQDLITSLQQDLAEKKIEIIELTERTDNLYELISERSECNDIIIVRGLEASFVDYIKPGYGGEGEYYKLDSVPRVLGNLNLQRERFRDELNVCIVFFLPLFGLKYFIRRAPDFYDWRSGTFEFLADEEHLEKEAKRLLKERRTIEQYNQLLPEERRKEFLKIQELLQEGHHSQKQAVKLWLESALLLDTSGEYEASLPFYDRALAIQPDQADAWYNQGITLRKLGRYEEAISNYDHALAIEPEKSQAWNARGVALQKLGQYQEAISSYERAIAISPDLYKGWYNLGNALMTLGDYSGALEKFAKTLEICPNYDQALYNSACMHSLLGNPEIALDFLEKTIQAAPEPYQQIAAQDSDLQLLQSNSRFHQLLCRET